MKHLGARVESVECRRPFGTVSRRFTERRLRLVRIRRDALAAPLQRKQPLSALAGKPIRLELALRRARRFALEVRR
jgi:hypothetical protein